MLNEKNRLTKIYELCLNFAKKLAIKVIVQVVEVLFTYPICDEIEVKIFTF